MDLYGLGYGGYGYGYDPTYLLVIIGMIFTIIVQMYMQSTFNKYKNIMSRTGMTANIAAERIMAANGIMDVKIGRVAGDLTDHYAPTKKELNLSETTYGSSSIAAIGVAAHEVGHAIQDHRRYAPLYFQMRIIPIVNFASRLSMPILLIGIVMSSFGLIKLGVILFAVTFGYQLITLPIEFNASRNAVSTLRNLNILSEDEIAVVKKVLTAAALTYVAAAASTALQLLRFILIMNNNKRRN